MIAGTVLAARYVVKQVISRTPTVTWLLVRDSRDGDAERVIQHIPLPRVDPRTLAARHFQFRSACDTLLRVRCAGLIAMLDRFSLPDAECVVTECVDGVPLARVVEMSVHGVSKRQAVEWASQLCETMSWLDDRPRPLLVGSLDPDDILVTPRDRVRLQVRFDAFLHRSDVALFAASAEEVDARMEAFGHLLVHLFSGEPGTFLRDNSETARTVNRCFLRRGRGGYRHFCALQESLQGLVSPAAPPTKQTSMLSERLLRLRDALVIALRGRRPVADHPLEK